MVSATATCSSAPPQIDDVRSASVPSARPAMMEPIVSGSGFWKWTMQYGIVTTRIAYAPSLGARLCRTKPRKKNSSMKNWAT